MTQSWISRRRHAYHPRCLGSGQDPLKTAGRVGSALGPAQFGAAETAPLLAELGDLRMDALGTEHILRWWQSSSSRAAGPSTRGASTWQRSPVFVPTGCSSAW